jgi:hypothetical protein
MSEVEILPPSAPIPGLIAHCGSDLVTRADLTRFATPEATDTHKPIPHAALVAALLETLSFRRLAVTEDQYAVSPDGMRMFGILVLDIEEGGLKVSIGVRNSHDKSVAVGITMGYRVIVCDNMAFHGDFETLTRKHSKKLVLEDVLAVAIDHLQRRVRPMLDDVASWRGHELSDREAKLIIYRAFIEDELEAAKHLAKFVHRHYFNPQYAEFTPRTLWSLSNAFTSAFKELDPLPRFRATARLAPFLSDSIGEN